MSQFDEELEALDHPKPDDTIVPTTEIKNENEEKPVEKPFEPCIPVYVLNVCRCVIIFLLVLVIMFGILAIFFDN